MKRLAKESAFFRRIEDEFLCYEISACRDGFETVMTGADFVYKEEDV